MNTLSFSELKKRYANTSDPTVLRNVLHLGWRVLLVTLCAALVGSFVFGAWILWTVMTDEELVTATSASASEVAVPISAADMDKVLTIFDQRTEHFQSIVIEGVNAPDPSR